MILLVVLALAQPVDCEMIRAHVAQYGKIRSYAWALANGYSPKEITRIRKQCGV